MTIALFHMEGTIPSRKELLKIAVIGGANRGECSFRFQPDISSGHVAFLGFTLVNDAFTVATAMINSLGISPSNVNATFSFASLGKSLLTDARN